MRKYWTCGKFADWLRGVESPGSATSEEWDVWTRFAKTMHPVRYWLADTGLRTLEDVWCWLPSRLNDVRYYLNNRYTTKTHALTSNLPRGQWHEFETRLLHSTFDTYVDFIEIETAWNHCMWDDDARKKFNMPWWRGQWWTRWFREWRCPEAGVAHLEWEMTLKNVEWVDESDPEYGKPTHQAVAAKEKWALYYWWKYVRPHRVDPHDYTGWTAYCEELREENGDGWLFSNHKKDPEHSRELLDRLNKLEEQYDAEDEEMLIRLIKLRKSLWT